MHTEVKLLKSYNLNRQAHTQTERQTDLSEIIILYENFITLSTELHRT